MSKKINRAVELLAEDQPIYYTGAHAGHVLTYEQGKEDAGTWADYINVGMEHGSFDMVGLDEYLRGLIAGGPTRSGHQTPTVIVEAPVEGRSEENRALQRLAVSADIGSRRARPFCFAKPNRPRPSGPLFESCPLSNQHHRRWRRLGPGHARRWFRGGVCGRVGREPRRVSDQGRSLAAQPGGRVAVRG